MRPSAAPCVVHVMPDKLGGVVTTAENLLRHRSPDALPQGVVLTHNRLECDTRYGKPLGGDWQRSVEFELPLENVRSVLARVARAIPRGPGVIVANDWLELAMLSVHDPGRTVIQVVHGDYEYYYDLAVRHDAVVDVYVGCSERITARLHERLPHRADSIVHLRHGIEIPRVSRSPDDGPLRLLFIGRLDRDKGVLDLPEIDARLLARGIAPRWTIVGDGPARDELRAAWPPSERVRHAGAMPREQIAGVCAAHDVFVLPTRAEGFPLVLLEAMASGLVAVASDIPSGVPELVLPDETGHRAPVGDTEAFASAIATLASDRGRLEALSAAARRLVVDRFEVTACAGAYHALFARWRELKRPRGVATLHYGSRLDQAWIPNAVVYALRSGARRLGTRRA
jgi:glycosyltransferase involved in cell wall biosynthesis